jgi:hypothetical protein
MLMADVSNKAPVSLLAVEWLMLPRYKLAGLFRT